MNKFIYITGCDGTGKTTQARILLEKLVDQGVSTRRVWLRFPFLISLPLLVYARLRGFSWYETTGGCRHGYWNFRRSWLLRTFLPWLLLVDATLAALVKIYYPLWRGKTIICERYVVDMIVDLSVAFSDNSFHESSPGEFFMRLLPPHSWLFLLDLDAPTIRERRPDLEEDHHLEAKLKLYRKLMDDLSLPTFSGKLPKKQINSLIIESIDNDKSWVVP